MGRSNRASRSRIRTRRSMKHYMIDIETFGTCESAMIISAAVLPFKLDGDGAEKPPERHFTPAIYPTWEDQCDAGATIDPLTLDWWFRQIGNGCVATDLEQRRMPASAAFAQFANSIQPSDCTRVWAKGPDFDCRILEAAFRRHSIACPWRYWQCRCVRTITDLADMPRTEGFSNSAHDALLDARTQIYDVQQAWRAINKIK